MKVHQIEVDGNIICWNVNAKISKEDAMNYGMEEKIKSWGYEYNSVDQFYYPPKKLLERIS